VFLLRDGRIDTLRTPASSLNRDRKRELQMGFGDQLVLLHYLVTAFFWAFYGIVSVQTLLVSNCRIMDDLERI
jgi:hypothetical protein